jgi:hypothetical protein
MGFQKRNANVNKPAKGLLVTLQDLGLVISQFHAGLIRGTEKIARRVHKERS